MPLEIPTGSLSFYDYCELLGIEPLSDDGAMLMSLMEDKANFEIKDLIQGSSGALKGLLAMVASWELFSGVAHFRRAAGARHH